MCVGWFKKKNVIDPPYPKEDIEHTEVLTVLKSELGEGCKIYLADVDYRTTTKEELERFLCTDKTDCYTYVSEYYDCDDFSFRLHGQLSMPGWGDLAFGIFWAGMPQGGGHAVNIFVDSDRRVWGIEPQTDEIFDIPDDWEPWLVIM